MPTDICWYVCESHCSLCLNKDLYYCYNHGFQSLCKSNICYCKIFKLNMWDIYMKPKFKYTLNLRGIFNGFLVISIHHQALSIIYVKSVGRGNCPYDNIVIKRSFDHCYLNLPSLDQYADFLYHCSTECVQIYWSVFWYISYMALDINPNVMWG